MKKVIFEKDAAKELNKLKEFDLDIYRKVVLLIKDIQVSSFSGLGKPEPLKHNFQGYWSRRITKEHRLVYKVTDESIIIASCKFHY